MKRSLFLLFAIVSVAGMIAFSGCDTNVTTYTVTFDANGGEGTMDTQLFTEDYEKALSANKFTREGFSFAGWNTMRDGSGTSYTDQQKIKVVADMTLYAQWNEERPVTMHNGHEYIDLGLPSGNLWATCNIGADAPEAAGNYYAWAETAPKQTYTTENYPYIRLVVEGEDTLQKLTKYCPHSAYGFEDFSDNLTSLIAEDDEGAAGVVPVGIVGGPEGEFCVGEMAVLDPFFVSGETDLGGNLVQGDIEVYTHNCLLAGEIELIDFHVSLYFN